MDSPHTSEASGERSRPWGWRYVAAVIGLILVYWLGALAGFFFKASFGDVTPIWPPSGLAVAIFIAWGIRFWPVVAIGEFITALSIPQPPLAGLIGGCAQFLEALAACRLLRLAGIDDITANARSVIHFTVLGAMLPPLLAALLGSLSLLYIGDIQPADFLNGLLTWWTGDAIGILVLTPILVQLARKRRIPMENASAPRFIAFVLLMLLIGIAITHGVGPHGAYLFFLLLPVAIVSALCFRLTGASASALLMTLIVYGLRPSDIEQGDFLTAVRMLFVGVTSFTAYLVAGFVRERDEAAARLRAMTIAIQQSEKYHALGTLAGGIAHDFNNLICIIRGHADLLDHEVQSNERTADYLRQIRNACNDATDLAKKILSFSRGGDDPARPIDVAPIVQEVTALVRSALPAHIELRTAFEAKQTTVRCAESQLKQIMMNLLTNAVHAISAAEGRQGRIEVQVLTRRIDAPVNPAFGARTGDYLVLAVSDNGVGIPAENLNKLFEPYFTTKAPGRGTGLGLSVVHGIVEELRGFIEVDSVVQRGTTMRVHLPLEPASAVSPR